MKQLNWYQIFGNTHKIPDGRTVEPTDDIQIWLNCADIWDKTYTTLAEVLTDTDTLLALITSNNAVDYMVRSTTWASGVSADSSAMTYIGQNNYCANTLLADATWETAICNSEYWNSVLSPLVPEMTSLTTPEGEVFYSGSGGGSSTYVVFRSDNTTQVIFSGAPFTIGYQFTKKVKIYRFYAQTLYSSQNRVANYKIQGSNDRNTWTDLYSATAPDTAAGQYQESVLSDFGEYNSYRFNCLTGRLANTGLIRLQFYGRKDI